MMAAATEAMGTARPMQSMNWPAHCGIVLGASALLLSLSMVLVRRAALRQIAGEPASRGRSCRASGAVRRVVGPPVLWKERRTPLLGRRKRSAIIVALLALGLLGTTYALCAREDVLTDEAAHVSYAVVFLCLGILVTAILPATCITSEKESQTWSLLLTTPVSDWEIICGKFLGVVRRCLPAWLFLFGHVALFTLAGLIHPVGIIQLAILAAWIVFFLSSTGLYFSTRFRHTTTAVIANVALAAGLWAVFPLLLGVALDAVGADTKDSLLWVYMDTNPVVHAAVITAATARHGRLAAYGWIQGGFADVGEATGWILFNLVLYVAVGLVFIALARLRLRRNPI
jgi:ABC-type transport system involved in multi-copper enzyme maturation permease subunit